MQTYIDTEGVEVSAQQLAGPTVLNTKAGEKCAEAGDWILYVADDNWPYVLHDDVFAASFTLKE